MIENKIHVPIDKNFYEVTIKAGILSEIGNKLSELGIKNTRKILIISNQEIANLFGNRLLDNLKKNN